MNKQDFLSEPSCHHCGQQATELHEVFPGSYLRNVSIKYHLQVPLCRVCHRKYHDKLRRSTRAVCVLWGVDFYKLRLAIENGDDIILTEYSQKILAEYWRVNYEINI